MNQPNLFDELRKAEILAEVDDPDFEKSMEKIQNLPPEKRNLLFGQKEKYDQNHA